MHSRSVLAVILCLLLGWGVDVLAQAEVPPDEGVWVPDTGELSAPDMPLAPAIDGGASPAAPGAPSATPVEPAAEEAKDVFYSLRLRGVNKVTAHVSVLEAPLGTVMRFGNLEILAKRCWKSPPEDQPENAALLDIWELKPNEQPERIFTGWMFSSSPAISALEHAVYDVTVLECVEGHVIDGEETAPKVAEPAVSGEPGVQPQPAPEAEPVPAQ